MHKTLFTSHLCLGLLLAGAPLALAQEGIDPKAKELVTAMSQKLASAKSLTATGTRHLDKELIAGSEAKENVDFELTLVRPGKINVVTKDKAGSRRLVSDGKKTTLVDQEMNHYATKATTGKTLDDLAASIEAKFGFRPVLAEFLSADPAAVLLAGVTKAEVEGASKVGGVKCTRLEFTQPYAEWDLWIGVEDQLPRKLEVKHTALKGKPGASVVIKTWSLDADVPADTFKFTPAKDVQEIGIIDLAAAE